VHVTFSSEEATVTVPADHEPSSALLDGPVFELANCPVWQE
jgi:hypothetical protein